MDSSAAAAISPVDSEGVDDQVEATEELNGLMLDAVDNDARFRPLPSSDTDSSRHRQQLLAASHVIARGSSHSVSPKRDARQATVTREPSPIEEGDIDVEDLISEGFTDNLTIYSATAAAEDSASQGVRASRGVMHWVKGTDTVVGLAFKYGISVRMLKCD